MGVSAGQVTDARVQLDAARGVLRQAADTLKKLSQSLGGEFCDAAEMIRHCRGSVLVIGMGKAGLVGQKVSATLASTGTRSYFVHPAEAIHGDLGRIAREDVVIMLSHSGTTQEIVRLLPFLDEMKVPVIAITASPQSPLGKKATLTLPLGEVEEAGALKLAPSTSTTAMMALGDALALVVSDSRNFQADDFARFHPGGNLGHKLSRVEDIMRPLSSCRIGTTDETVREVLIRVGQPGRRTGAIMLVNQQGILRGVFTDSDLARLFEFRRDDRVDGPIEWVMTKDPLTVARGALLTDAIEVMSGSRISELPVVDEEGKPCGLIDITDVLTVPVEADSPENVPENCKLDSEVLNNLESPMDESGIDPEDIAPGDMTPEEIAPEDDFHDGPDTIPFVRPGEAHGQENQQA